MTDMQEEVNANEDLNSSATFNEANKDLLIEPSVLASTSTNVNHDNLLLDGEIKCKEISPQGLDVTPLCDWVNSDSTEIQSNREENQEVLVNYYANEIKVPHNENSTAEPEISHVNVIEVPQDHNAEPQYCTKEECAIIEPANDGNAEFEVTKKIYKRTEEVEELNKVEVQKEDDFQKEDVQKAVKETFHQYSLDLQATQKISDNDIVIIDDNAHDTIVNKRTEPQSTIQDQPGEIEKSSVLEQEINNPAYGNSHLKMSKCESKSQTDEISEPTNSSTNSLGQEIPDMSQSKSETINVNAPNNSNNCAEEQQSPEKTELNDEVGKIVESSNTKLSAKDQQELEKCESISQTSKLGEPIANSKILEQLSPHKVEPKCDSIPVVESRHDNNVQDKDPPKPDGPHGKDLPNNNSNQPAPSKKGLMQLEQMSHEDLLKQCKRQLLFLQKTKMKNDDLSRSLLELQNEHQILKESSTKTGVSGELLRRLQSENDSLLDEKESQAEVVAQLNKDIAKLVGDLTTCKEQMEETKSMCNQLKESLASAATEKKVHDALVLELQSQLIVLRSERDSDTKKMGEKHSELEYWEAKCSSLQNDVEAKGKECLDMQSSLNQLKQELEQEKVLSLEIGDYERTLKDLNDQLAKEKKTVEDLNLQMLKMREGQDVLQKEIGHLEQQCISEESRSTHLKEILETTRQQLGSKCEEYDKLSSALVETKHQKEDILASKEELQFQLSVASNNLLILENELKQNRDQSEKLDLSLKSRISSLTEELSDARQQLEASRKEFHSYKVRVHSVLKQQKVTGSASGQPVSNLPVNDDEQKGQMEWTLELCKGKISQMTEQISTLTVERDSLQKEQEWLVSKQNLFTQHMQEKEETLLQRLEESRQELDLSRSLWDTEKHQLLQQQKDVILEYDHRLQSLEVEHERHVSTLVTQLEQLQRNASVFNSLSLDQTSTPQGHSHRTQIFDMLPAAQLSPSVDESFDICSQERQEGEGSECTDPLPAPAAFQTLVTSPASGFMPLERLLQAEPSPTYGNQDPEMIAITINTLQKKVDHISELLNESEASNLRLSEQARLLKEEIRRLERNTERHEHFNNLEYLKNIVLKFNTTPNGSERERLVPVISTLLRLSPEEQAQMKLVANQDAGNPNGNAGWGNYLHRWSGLV